MATKSGGRTGPAPGSEAGAAEAKRRMAGAGYFASRCKGGLPPIIRVIISKEQLLALKDLLDRRVAEREAIRWNFAEFADAADRDKISDWLKARKRESQPAVVNQPKDR